jgi:hypothetical protein
MDSSQEIDEPNLKKAQKKTTKRRKRPEKKNMGILSRNPSPENAGFDFHNEPNEFQ